MNLDFLFFMNSVLLGIGLAMDAFSVSAANGLQDPHMKKRKMLLIAGTFAAFQILMPLLGWVCVSRIAELFRSFQKFIPWIALLLLLFIGGKMLIEGIRGGEEEECRGVVCLGTLMIQGIATSIDALSVGFTIAELNVWEAVIESVIIGIVTFIICIGGVLLGKTFGTRLSGKASVLGGVILIAIGIEIFVKGVFF